LKYQLDCHCHSISSGHAYSTIDEIARTAHEKKIKMIAITDHGPALPGGPHKYHFSNLKVIPESLHGVEILKGIEANIIDWDGNLDLDEKRLANLDIVLAGYHSPPLKPKNKEAHTETLIKVIENPFVDVIVHPGNPVFPIDFHTVLEAARVHETLIEINNSSLGVSRKGSYRYCLEIAELCRDHNVRVLVGSDCHIANDVGEFGKASKIFHKIDMPKDLIMNLDADVFKSFLRKKGKARFN
jgi:putative hydrolase